MQTLREVRKELDEKFEELRKLQRDNMMATTDRKQAIQNDVGAVSSAIGRLDTVIQSLINPKPKL